jgi:GNAT superfamily N-acetyltransferase
MSVRSFLSKGRSALRLIATGHWRSAWSALRARLWSDTRAVGLRRDVTVPFTPPPAKLAVDVTPLRPDDDLAFLTGSTAAADAYWHLNQLRLLEVGLPTCWVARAADEKVCYMQWLIRAVDSDRVRELYGPLFPRLAPDEALLEGAFTPAAFRGQGIMAHAMARIAERARDLGARWVITFVEETNAASLKGCQRAGFAPYTGRRESLRWLRRRVTFSPLSP